MQTANIISSSFPQKRESTVFMELLDSRFCGNDDWVFNSMKITIWNVY